MRMHNTQNPFYSWAQALSVSTSPEIQEFSGYLWDFPGEIKSISRIKKNQELAASYTIDIEDSNLLVLYEIVLTKLYKKLLLLKCKRILAQMVSG